MDVLRFFGNILWFVLGGLLMGLGWYLAGLIMLLTVVGAPWAFACFRIGSFAFFPFGKDVVRRDAYSGQEDLGTGALGFVLNVIWFLLAGWWLCIGHLASALANAVTIIGIPFAFQHLKLARFTLAPVGVSVVPAD